MKPSVLDLFSGAGGFSYGFKQAGFNINAAVDNDSDSLNTHKRNFSHCRTLLEDIRVIQPRRIFSKEEFTVIIGGLPGQGFSSIGRPKIASLVRSGIWNHLSSESPRLINDPRNVLYRNFVSIVSKLKPSFFVMENVPGLLNYKKGKAKKQIIRDFASIGYKTDMKILNTANYGVPQLRKRLFFVGNCLDIRNPFPKPEYSPKGSPMKFSRNLNLEKQKSFVTLGEAILDLPEIENCGGKEEMSYTKPPCSKYQKLMREKSKKVYNYVSRCSNKRDISVFNILKEGEIYNDLPQEIKNMLPFRQDIFFDKIRKMNRNKPSWTIVAHLYKDGYMFIHPTQARSITVREAARIQSFPDTFVFRGSRTSQFKQVGNAIPPLMAFSIGHEIKKVL